MRSCFYSRRHRLAERGEKLSSLAEKTSQMQTNAEGSSPPCPIPLSVVARTEYTVGNRFLDLSKNTSWLTDDCSLVFPEGRRRFAAMAKKIREREENRSKLFGFF